MSRHPLSFSVLAAASLLVCAGAAQSQDLHAGHAHVQKQKKNQEQAVLPQVTVTATRRLRDRKSVV